MRNALTNILPSLLGLCISHAVKLAPFIFYGLYVFDLVSKFLDRQLQITDSLGTALSVTGVWSMYEHVECKLL